MSEENKNSGNNVNAADNYINEQLAAAQSSLGRTKMMSIILVIIVLAYMSFVTKSILAHLEPQQAADTAKAVLVTQLSTKGQLLADQLKMKIPEVMQQIPELVLNRMPAIREDIENRISSQLENYVRLTAEQLEPQFEQFLKDNEDSINKFLDATQDKEALKEDLSSQFDDMIAQFMQTKTGGPDTLMEKFQTSQELLVRIADQTQRLAHDEDLNEREKQTRRAIAVLLAKSDFTLYDNTREEVSSAGTDGDE